MIFKLFPFLFYLCVFLLSGTGWAIEVAPRISDREIIDKLARLEEGQKSIRQEIGQRFEAVNQSQQSFRQEMSQRFDAINQSQQNFRQEIDKRFETINQNQQNFRQEINQRFSFLETLMSIMIAGILGLVGFIIWDRKTALRPLEKKIDRLGQDMDLELKNSDSRLSRLILALREQAQEDPKLASTLQNFSLL